MQLAEHAQQLAAFNPSAFGSGLFLVVFGVLLWTPAFARLIAKNTVDPSRVTFPLVPRSPVGLRIFGTALIVFGIGGLGAGFVG